MVLGCVSSDVGVCMLYGVVGCVQVQTLVCELKPHLVELQGVNSR